MNVEPRAQWSRCSGAEAAGVAGVPALVLAAGQSTRISAVTGGGPKPLLEVAGRPLLEWNLTWLASHGVRRVWINLHHEGGAIRATIGNGARLGVDVRYSEEPMLLGTAGGWRRVAEAWPSTSLVVYGDNLMRFDLNQLLRVHREIDARATVALFDPARHANTGKGGGVAVLSVDGRVRTFREGVEPDSGLISAGVYALEPEVLDFVEAGYQDFGHDVLSGLAEVGWLGGHVIETSGFCLGLDTPERYERALALVAAGAVAP